MSNPAFLTAAQGVGVMVPRAAEIKCHGSSALSPPPVPNPSLSPLCSQCPLCPRSVFFFYGITYMAFVILVYLPPRKQTTGLFLSISQALDQRPTPTTDAQVKLLDEGIKDYGRPERDGSVMPFPYSCPVLLALGSDKPFTSP